MIKHDVVMEVLNATVEMVRAKGLLSSRHFSVEGTQINASDDHKSVRRKDGRGSGKKLPGSALRRPKHRGSFGLTGLLGLISQ